MSLLKFKNDKIITKDYVAFKNYEWLQHQSLTKEFAEKMAEVFPLESKELENGDKHISLQLLAMSFEDWIGFKKKLQLCVHPSDWHEVADCIRKFENGE